jgi:DNA-directed RNA polymerase subunit RPC12/RpoP
MNHSVDTETDEPVRCPFCHAMEVQIISLFGSQLLTSQYRCLACRSYFEGLREDRWAEASSMEETPHGR